MYKAIIVEDEHKLSQALHMLLQLALPGKVQVIGVAGEVANAAHLINTLQPDIVFMDIQLKDGTGFDVIEKCTTRKFHLIFTTAYQQHAIQAFKYSALDYLLKPIDLDELKNAVTKIVTLQTKFANAEQLNVLQTSLDTTPTKLTLPTHEGIHIVVLTDIVRCETSGSYTTFHFADGKKIMVSRPLKSYDDILIVPQFFRIHQSHTINLAYVKTYSKEGGVHLKTGETLPVAQRKKEQFYRIIKTTQ
jgi:two-component system, LytTR family, response regulator